MFLPHEAEIILSISLSLSLPPDRRTWGVTNNGKFTVSNAYRLIIEDCGRSVLGENYEQSMMKQLWRRIWGMRTLNKVRNFTWRACKNILATKTNLKKCHITNNDLCLKCNMEAETSGHMFWFCDRAKEVWSRSKMAFPFLVDDKWEFLDMI